MSNYSTLEDQLALGTKLYVLDSNGEYKPASYDDVDAWCKKNHKGEYLWTSLFIVLIVVIVLCLKKTTG